MSEAIVARKADWTRAYFSLLALHTLSTAALAWGACARLADALHLTEVPDFESYPVIATLFMHTLGPRVMAWIFVGLVAAAYALMPLRRTAFASIGIILLNLLVAYFVNACFLSAYYTATSPILTTT